jgi:3-oxoacyl-[acyl-carrier protein] reductase
VSRAVIVTGGARGIGRALCQRLAGEGGRVAIWDRDGAEAGRAAAALGSGHLALACDIADPSAVAEAAEATFAAFGRVDGLVNNAGILGPVAPLWEQTEAEFRRVTDVNQIGTFLVCRAVVPRLLAQSPDARGIRARIVNLSSIQAKDGMALSGAYSASKAAVIAMTKVLGKELALHGIPVNAVTPVAAETDMAREIAPARRTDILSRIPMGRFVTVEEIAAMIGWLLSDDCTFSTGAVFDLSGGRATY